MESKTAPRRIARKEEVCCPGRFTSLPLDLLADPKLTPAAKLVAAALLDCLRPGEAWCCPSIPGLAAATALGRRTVIRAIAALEARKWIAIEKKIGGPNGYAFALSDELDGLAAFPSTQGQVEESDVPAPARPLTGDDEAPSSSRGDADDFDPSSAAGPAVGPVPKLHPPRAKSTRVPVPKWHRSGAKMAPPIHLSKQEEDKHTHKGRARACKPTLLEELLAKQIDEAYRTVFDMGMPRAWRQRIDAEYDDGDPAILWRIDAKAIRAGVELASDRGGTFGFGWVLRYVADKARTAKERKEGQARAAKAARQARQEQRQAAEDARAIAKCFAALDPAEQARLRKEARTLCKLRNPKPELIDTIASHLAHKAAEVAVAGKGE